MDKELLILNAVGCAPELSQRALAQKTGLSLGSINILIKKMVREGFIKLEKLPPDRIAYTLTPKGLEEKINKTKAYIHGHYSALERMRSQLSSLLRDERFMRKMIGLSIEQFELRELVLQVTESAGIYSTEGIPADFENSVVISDYNKPFSGCEKLEWINIHEYLKLG